MDKALLREHAEGLIGLSGLPEGRGRRSAVARQLRRRRRRRSSSTRTSSARATSTSRSWTTACRSRRRSCRTCCRLSTETGAPAVATNDSHYLRRDDAFAHEVLLCIGMGKTLEDERRMRFYNDEFYVKNPDEMKARFRPWSAEAVTNSVAIAERCAVTFDTEGLHLPTFPAPPGQTPAEYFGDLAHEGLERRLAELHRSWRPRIRRREVPRAARVRDRRHREDGLPVLLPDRLGLHPLRAGARDLRRARAAGSAAGLDRLVGAADHGDRPAPVRPPLRAVPEPGAHLDARHRHRLLPGAPRRGHRVRHEEVRARERGADRDVLAAEAEARRPRRRARALAARSRSATGSPSSSRTAPT